MQKNNYKYPYLFQRKPFQRTEEAELQTVEFGFFSANLASGGAERDRTAVQTSHPSAFYTLILPLIFVQGLPEGGPTLAYPLNLGRV